MGLAHSDSYLELPARDDDELNVGQDTDGSCPYSAARQTSTNLGSIKHNPCNLQGLFKRWKQFVKRSNGCTSKQSGRVAVLFCVAWFRAACATHTRNLRWLFAAGFWAWGLWFES